MKEWWLSLSQRERLLVSIGGLVLILLLAYYIIWEPISDGAAQAKREAQSNASLLAWMTKADQLIEQSGHKYTPQKHTSTNEQLVVIQQTLKANNLENTVQKLEQTHHGQVKIQFKGAYFDMLSTWLIDLWKEHGIGVYNASLQKTKTLGEVDGSVILSSASSTTTK